MSWQMKYEGRHLRKAVVSQEETNLNLCNEEKLNHSSLHLLSIQPVLLFGAE